ncbi:MAG: hypothetical protein QME12_03880 [Nanoarchaeota archaeon]|nr:hypothetical protein [Nanoarchaeota archaeon]
MNILPKTNAGKWAVRLLLVFIGFFIFMQALVMLGQEGGETFSDNLYLLLTFLSMALSGVSAFATSAIAIIRKERALLVLLAAFIGLLFALLLLGENFGQAH